MRNKKFICVLFTSIIATLSVLPCAMCYSSEIVDPVMLSADVNKDGIINMSDVIALSIRYNSNLGDTRYNAKFDLNNDGTINMADVLILAKYFNRIISVSTPTQESKPTDAISVISGDYLFDSTSGMIKKYNGTGIDVTIPDVINGVSVASIGDGAFAACSDLRTVMIPESVTNIGNSAFVQCTSLTTLKIPDSVTKIGEAAFANCTSLRIVKIPDSVTSIGGSAFAYCDINNITIPDSVKSLRSYAFKECPISNAVFLGDQPSNWEDNVFTEVKDDFKIIISSTAKGFGKPVPYNDETSWSWSPDKNNTYKVVISGTSADYLFDSTTGIIRKYNGTGGSVTIPDTINGVYVTSIGDGAFAGCSKLTGVRMPDNITTIGNGAFAQCTNLSTVEISNSVTTIGGSAFLDCNNLRVLKIPNGVTTISGFAFGNCGIKNITIPESVTDLNGTIFAGCPLSNAVFLGDQPSNWGKNVFAGVKEDFKIIISPTAKGFGRPVPYNNETSWSWSPDKNNTYKVYISGTSADYLFDSTTGMIIKYNGTGGSVTIPDTINGVKVTSIGDGAFAGCSKLTGVRMPDSVTSIKDGAFAQCTNLSTVEISNSVTTIGGSAFLDCNNLRVLKIPNGVTTISGFAFGNCGIKNITIPESVTDLNGTIFAGCPLSNAVFLGDQPSNWGKNVFAGVKEDLKIIISPTAKGFGRPVPYNNEISWSWSPDGKDTYKVFISGTSADYIFDSTTGIINKYNGTGGEVAIPDTINGVSVKTIGDGAFAGCTKLIDVTIPDSVTSIKDGAFAQCTNLANVTIPDSVDMIGQAAFTDCTSLKTVKIPNSVTTIGGSAFANCGITNITIPESVNDLSWLAFLGCPLSNAVFLGDQPSNWGDNVFVQVKDDFKIIVSPTAKGFGRPVPYKNETSWNWSADKHNIYKVVIKDAAL